MFIEPAEKISVVFLVVKPLSYKHLNFKASVFGWRFYNKIKS